MDIITAISRIGQVPDSLQTILGLFDFVPNIYFYIKDKDRRFLWMNEPLRQLLGANSIEDCIGKRDSDFFTSDLVFLYHQEDDVVFMSRRPLLHRPWIVARRADRPKWFLSSKIPLFGADDSIVALAGIMLNINHDLEIIQPLSEMQTAVDYVIAHYHERIDIETLASLAFLSTRQFERRFQNLFHMPPSEFILKVRLDTAIRHLTESDLPITQIAIQCGFYDNSHFTRLFKRKLGVSPIQFRKKFA